MLRFMESGFRVLFLNKFHVIICTFICQMKVLSKQILKGLKIKKKIENEYPT